MTFNLPKVDSQLSEETARELKRELGPVDRIGTVRGEYQTLKELDWAIVTQSVPLLLCTQANQLS